MQNAMTLLLGNFREALFSFEQVEAQPTAFQGTVECHLS